MQDEAAERIFRQKGEKSMHRRNSFDYRPTLKRYFHGASIAQASTFNFRQQSNRREEGIVQLMEEHPAAKANGKKSLYDCDLCGSAESIPVAEAFAHHRGQLAVCSSCGLIYASPRESEDSLDTFNEEIFDGDAGTRIRAGSGFPDPEYVVYQEHLANWSLKFMQRNIEIKGKRILDVRCQSGALSAALKVEGAEVFSVDPFEANLNYCKQKRDLSNVFRLPFSRFTDLPIPINVQFDAVTALMDHVLSHLLSPRKFLRRVLELLKPGGYLFLVEKDVLSPSWASEFNIQFVLDSGRSHQHHLTPHTVARYVVAAGFELKECEVDNERMTAYRQIRVLARKPEGGLAPVRISQMLNRGPTAEAIQRRLRWLRWIWRLHGARLALERRLKLVPRRIRRILGHFIRKAFV